MPLNALSAAPAGPGAPSSPEYAESIWSKPRWVWLKRSTTGEQIRETYWANGQVVDHGYQMISWFMRDLRFERMLARNDPVITRALAAGRIGQQDLSQWMLMDIVLLDVLYAHNAWLQFFGVDGPIIFNSGLRHMLTNEITEGAARDSPHMRGSAGDIVIPGVPPARVAAFSRWLQAGGVGLYPSKGFTHVDRGRVRSWVS